MPDRVGIGTTADLRARSQAFDEFDLLVGGKARTDGR